jgi:Flp pilus assembly protein TadG
MPSSRSLGRRPGFARRDNGQAAVEFALVLPVLLILALGVAEMTNYIMAWLKVRSASTTAADLVARQEQTTPDALEDVVSAVHVIMAPFDSDRIDGSINHVEFDDDGTASCTWSHAIDGGDDFDPIDGIGELAEPNQGVIVLHVHLNYQSITGDFFELPSAVSEVAYAAPRRTRTIPCRDDGGGDEACEGC